MQNLAQPPPPRGSDPPRGRRKTSRWNERPECPTPAAVVPAPNLQPDGEPTTTAQREKRRPALAGIPARHRTAVSPRARLPCRPSPAWRITAMISSTRGGSAGKRLPLLTERRPDGTGDTRPPSAGTPPSLSQRARRNRSRRARFSRKAGTVLPVEQREKRRSDDRRSIRVLGEFALFYVPNRLLVRRQELPPEPL